MGMDGQYLRHLIFCRIFFREKDSLWQHSEGTEHMQWQRGYFSVKETKR